MFWKRRVAVFMEHRPPNSMGLPLLSPAIRRCATEHFSGFVALARKAGGMGLMQEDVAGGCPYLNLGGLQFEIDGAGAGMCWGLDPDVPIVQVSPEPGAAVVHTVGFREHEPRDGLDGCREPTQYQWAALIDPTAGMDVRVRPVMAHAVCSGARVTSGEHRGQVRIMLPVAVQHVASGHFLEGRLEVKSKQDVGVVLSARSCPDLKLGGLQLEADGSVEENL